MMTKKNDLEISLAAEKKITQWLRGQVAELQDQLARQLLGDVDNQKAMQTLLRVSERLGGPVSFDVDDAAIIILTRIDVVDAMYVEKIENVKEAWARDKDIMKLVVNNLEHAKAFIQPKPNVPLQEKVDGGTVTLNHALQIITGKVPT